MNYDAIYRLALAVAKSMGDDLQKFSWKWKNKPEYRGEKK